jgi:16S rRNA G966 N2-methylase RsmD
MLHGVDTCGGGASADKLEITSANAAQGIAYDPCAWPTLQRALRLVSLRPEGFTFVDIGSGKGKVLLSALGMPFKHIVGVEYSSYLSRIAEQNVASARLLKRRCSSVEIICSDAVLYPIPEEPTIFFFANPFGYDIMERVLSNITTSYWKVPRSMFLIFYRTSSIMRRVDEFLSANSDGRASRRISVNLCEGSLNIFELPHIR